MRRSIVSEEIIVRLLCMKDAANELYNMIKRLSGDTIDIEDTTIG